MERLFQKSASFSSVSSVTFWSVFTQISSRYTPLRDRSLSPGGSSQRILVVSQCHLPDPPPLLKVHSVRMIPPLLVVSFLQSPLFLLCLRWLTPPPIFSPWKPCDLPHLKKISWHSPREGDTITIRMEKQWWWCPVPSDFNFMSFPCQPKT